MISHEKPVVLDKSILPQLRQGRGLSIAMLVLISDDGCHGERKNDRGRSAYRRVRVIPDLSLCFRIIFRVS